MPNSDEGDHAPIGFLCAMPEERALLLDALVAPTDLSDDVLRAHLGRLDGCPIVLAEAGVGKVEAATSATLLLERHGCGALILSGVAGGLDAALGIGDLVVATRVVDVDYGRATDEGRVLYQPGTLPLPHIVGEPGYQLPVEIEDLVRERLDELEAAATLGTILSGDAFLASAGIRDELATPWSALAIEMESAAICGVARRFDVPWLIVRALSDRAGEHSSIDFSTFVSSAAASAARVVRALLPVMVATSR
ncbi:MAG: 5'-methylthioadenosine/S-adenosylhomocysteine nucleosidase [Chloroflexota bacterium]